ncbi:MAG: DUF4838 domain-containing protein [Clostridia bacterium]|nr:DUF4838 domain-containing protein [Clostridia bacterium]
MLTINKLRVNQTVDFAAEELKKYLRMMMPECGDIEIRLDPDAKDGFRLGLLEDFGFSTEEVEDAVLDDVVHIDTEKDGGILAGSNPRSILFAVYRFLRLNGCRWLYPGVDGDYVPMKEIEGKQYHKKADHRFRGHCNEGAEFQQCMLETIDFYAKQELNVYMLEFFIPYGYYHHYYSHQYNEFNRSPETITPDMVLQWKRQCEFEIGKRGLQFHDMGHGWTAEPFGMTNRSTEIPEETRQYLALVGGKRDLYRGHANWTNLCYSNPYVRSKMADAVVDYAEKHTNVTYLHVWLADLDKNHCECEECKKKTPSDWYMLIMNEIDEKMTAKGLSTRVVFIAYVDTQFAPKEFKIENPDRFSLLYAPISRSYLSSIHEDAVLPEPAEFRYNDWTTPTTAEESMALFREWQKVWNGPCFSYEYHFWHHQHRDPSGLYIARRIYEDIRGLKYAGLNGYVEDGSQRSFWPNGFAIYVYAETLLNREIKFEELLEDYYSHIYGEDWEKAYDLLRRIEKAFDYEFLAGKRSTDFSISKYYGPHRVPQLETIHDLAAEERALVEKNLSASCRPQAVSWRLLRRHAEFCDGLCEIVKAKAAGQNYKAVELAEEFKKSFGRHEFELERYYDHYLSMHTVGYYVKNPTGTIFN